MQQQLFCRRVAVCHYVYGLPDQAFHVWVHSRNPQFSVLLLLEISLLRKRRYYQVSSTVSSLAPRTAMSDVPKHSSRSDAFAKHPQTMEHRISAMKVVCSLPTEYVLRILCPTFSLTSGAGSEILAFIKYKQSLEGGATTKTTLQQRLKSPAVNCSNDRLFLGSTHSCRYANKDVSCSYSFMWRLSAGILVLLVDCDKSFSADGGCLFPSRDCRVSGLSSTLSSVSGHFSSSPGLLVSMLEVACLLRTILFGTEATAVAIALKPITNQKDFISFVLTSRKPLQYFCVARRLGSAAFLVTNVLVCTVLELENNFCTF